MLDPDARRYFERLYAPGEITPADIIGNREVAEIMGDTESVSFDDLPSVIGIHGFAQAGKDSVARVLCDSYGYKKLAFADAIRDALYTLNPVIPVPEGMYGVFHSIQYLVDNEGWDTAKVTYPEVRRLLQVFGTEVGREMIDPDIWVKITFNKMVDGQRYVIPDVRFQNEVVGLTNHKPDAVLIKVHRPGVGPVNAHVSDQGLADDLFPVHIHNMGNLTDLERAVHALVKVMM